MLKNVTRNLADFFGGSTRLDAITAGHVDDFVRWLKTSGRKRGKTADSDQGLSPVTIGKRLQLAAMIFRDAARRKLISENPFGHLKQMKASNPERQTYVPADVIERAIEHAPDSEWRLLIAMARYLGLRTPLEPFSLKWGDVDWERSRITITSPKTEHHGKGYRVVPILPEVRQHLLDCEATTPEGAVFVFERLRRRASIKRAEQGYWMDVNLRTNMLRILKRAGVQPWPRLFHGLRASAQTDLAGRFPLHVVCAWLGNSQEIASKHYLQVTDDHFAAAIDRESSDSRSAESPAPILSNPGLPPDALSDALRRGKGWSDAHPTRVEMKKPLVSKGFDQTEWRQEDDS